jgi:hypothetical protein
MHDQVGYKSTNTHAAADTKVTKAQIIVLTQRALAAQTSNSVSARPLRPPSSVLNLRLVEINGSAVRLAFTRPLEAVTLSGNAISRLFAPDTPVSVTSHKNQTLQTIVAVQAVNPGGRGKAARIQVRPFPQASSPLGFEVLSLLSLPVQVQIVTQSWRPFPLALSPLGFEVISLLALLIQEYK